MSTFRERILPSLLAWAVRALSATWRVRRVRGELLHDSLESGPIIAAFFHEDQLPMVALHRGLGFSGLASRSADGALLAGVIARLGYGVVRGSSSKGAVAGALAALRRALGEGHSVGIAVDGPRGPRRVAQPGAAALAALSGRPLLLLTAHAQPAWRASSWDRFLLPLPFARVELRYDRFPAPPGGREARARATAELELRMRALAGEDGVDGEPIPRR
jgi:lysophospholipid acyltransferase (LPLAT)-like uncharacterized protein